MKSKSPSLSPFVVPSLAAAAIMLCATGATAQKVTADIKKMSASFAARGMATSPHTPLAVGPRVLQGSAALNATKASGHAPKAAAATSGANSPILAKFAPSATSSLSSGARSAGHAPVGTALMGASSAKKLQASSATTHMPAEKAKP